MLTVDNGLLCSESVNIYQEEGAFWTYGALSISCLNKLRPDEIINKNKVCILSGEITILWGIMKFLNINYFMMV